MACAWSTRRSAWIVPPAAMRFSGIWCWLASSSRPARSTRCGCWPRPASTRSPTGRSPADCRAIAKASFRAALSAACAGHAGLGPASLVLYDVTTLYFETDAGDGFREPGFSKERRLEPQITVGLLTDATGFPLAVEAFKGNKAETDTMLPVINAFKTAHQLTDVTVVADAGMISEANQKRHPRSRVVVHPGHPDPLRAAGHLRMARPTPRQEIPDGRCSPSRGRPPPPRRPEASLIG